MNADDLMRLAREESMVELSSELDKTATLLGMSRMPDEEDKDLRERLKTVLSISHPTSHFDATSFSYFSRDNSHNDSTSKVFDYLFILAKDHTIKIDIEREAWAKNEDNFTRHMTDLGYQHMIESTRDKTTVIYWPQGVERGLDFSDYTGQQLILNIVKNSSEPYNTEKEENDFKKDLENL